MKKIIAAAALLAATATMTAQTTVEGSKFFDNWSFGLNGGIVTPFCNHAFWGASKPMVGFNLQKNLTPVFGIGVEGQFGIKTYKWFNEIQNTTFFNHSYVGPYASFNLMNAFAGYKGQPRVFEMELTAGAGWIHAFNNEQAPYADEWDADSWGTRVGLNFNFNLGEAKAWTLSLRPAMLWNMNASTRYYGENLDSRAARYNVNYAAVELTAGVAYHFGNSNGTHSFVLARLYDQDLVDNLNATLNGLKGDLENCNANTGALRQKIANLESELEACNNRPAIVKEVTKNLNNVRYIFFQIGSSYIQANQKPNLELTAKALKEQAGSKLSIAGYASPEGSKALNQRLSQRRADAVKNALVKDYNVDANRISTDGKGVGDIFSVPSWNRVAVMTVE